MSMWRGNCNRDAASSPVYRGYLTSPDGGAIDWRRGVVPDVILTRFDVGIDGCEHGAAVELALVNLIVKSLGGPAFGAQLDLRVVEYLVCIEDERSDAPSDIKHDLFSMDLLTVCLGHPQYLPLRGVIFSCVIISQCRSGHGPRCCGSW